MFFKLDANQARIINLAPLDIESILLFSSRRHNNKFSLTEIYILQLKFIIYYDNKDSYYIMPMLIVRINYLKYILGYLSKKKDCANE